MTQGPSAAETLPIDADLLQAGAQRIGAWRLETVLGEGATSVVYAAVHVVDARRRALKVQRVAGGAASARLRREGVLQLRLRHPNLVAVEEVIELDGRVALVAERVEGTTLTAWTAQRHPVPLARASALIGGLLEGLDAAHRGGVIHRDLKPDNVLVAQGDRPMLGDFGTAKQLGEPIDPIVTVAGTPMGTPGFMAPEQWADASGVGPRADLFSWGAVAFYVLTGRPPFSGPDPTALLRASLDGRQLDLLALRPDCPPGLAAMVSRCLSVHPAMRPASVAAIRRVLDGGEVEHPLNPVPDTLLPAAARPLHGMGEPTDAPQPPAFPGRSATTRSLSELDEDASPVDDAAPTPALPRDAGAAPGAPLPPTSSPPATLPAPAGGPAAATPTIPGHVPAPGVRPQWWIIGAMAVLSVAAYALLDAPAEPVLAAAPGPSAPAEPATVVVAAAPATATVTPRCTAMTATGRVGWYWSESKPTRGLRRTSRIDKDTNVRAEARSDATVVCILSAGSRLRASSAAVEVGDHYWVPFEVADLRAP